MPCSGMSRNYSFLLRAFQVWPSLRHQLFAPFMPRWGDTLEFWACSFSLLQSSQFLFCLWLCVMLAQVDAIRESAQNPRSNVHPTGWYQWHELSSKIQIVLTGYPLYAKLHASYQEHCNKQDIRSA